MQKYFTRRVLTALAVALVIVCAVCIMATAEALKFDFTAYDKTTAAEDGWSVFKPEVEAGAPAFSSVLTVAEKSVGIYETYTKVFGEISNDIYLNWDIPAEKQFKIKNYGEFVLERRTSNGGTLVGNYGTTYTVVFTMDDGQSFEIVYPWVDLVKGYSAAAVAAVDNDFQKYVAELNGDPTLVNIKWYPYSADKDYHIVRASDLWKPAIADNPDTPDVDETQKYQAGLDHYTLLRYMEFRETAEVPAGLEGVKDTWDGTETGIHDGKITGLDAAKTYKYAPVHSLDAAFVEVSGVTEITGLVGGVYEVYAVEEGKSKSSNVIVIIPKDVQGEYDNLGINNGASWYEKSAQPLSGFWTHALGKPAGASQYVTRFYSKPIILNKHTSTGEKVAFTRKATEYFRRNIDAVYYAFTPEQQADVDTAYLHFEPYMSSANYPVNDADVPITSEPVTAMLYVYLNGDMENPVEVPFKFNSLVSRKAVYVNLANEYDGYITAIKYVQFYDLAEEMYNVDRSTGDGYHFIWGARFIDLKPSDFAPVAIREADGSYAITGLKTDKEYKFSADGNEWQTVTGATAIKGLDVGTYYVQELSSDLSYAPSDVITVDIKGGAMFVGDPVADGKIIKGLDASAKYEIAPANYFGTGEWTAIEEGATQTAELDYGLWAVRVIGENGFFPSAVKYVLISGSELYGSIAYSKTDKTTTDFLQGYWTAGGGTGAACAGPTNFGADRVMGMGASAPLYENRMLFAYRYALEDGEIRPINAVSDFLFYMTYGNGNPWKSNSFTARFRLYVTGGDVEYYDVYADHSNNVKTTAYVSAVVPADAKGYLTAIEIHPVYEVNGDKTHRTMTASPYPILYIGNYVTDESLENADINKFRIDINAMESPTGLNVEEGDNMGYYMGYKITGFDPEVIYEVSDPKGVITELTGVTELEGVFAGTYLVRIKGTETAPASRWAECFVPQINPVFGVEGTTLYPSTAFAGDIMEDGKWVVNPYENMSFAQGSNTFYVGSNTKLSDVYFSYGFPEADRFNVDEHPYLYADFRNEMVNMAIVTAYIKDAIYAVDVYVEGEDTPYTIESKWKGYQLNSGKTYNQIIINLIEKFPEIAGKTVRGFVIRPFANVDLTPNDYNNVEGVASRYLYFRNYAVGFLDVPANWQTLMFATNTAVSSLTGIRAESSVIYSIGATPKASDFNVWEIYSDGTENATTNFTIEVADDFATTAGKAIVTIKCRGYEAEVEVAVGLESIAIKSLPKTEYFEGDKVDLAGLELVAVLGDGTEIVLTDGIIADIDTVALGTTSITLSFGGKTVSYDITVSEVALSDFTVNSWPDKELAGGYDEGEPIDLTGLTILAIYNNGKTEVVTLENLEWKYAAEVMTRGATLEIKYGDIVKGGFVLTVNSRAISEVSVATPADKTVYMVGEEIDLTGLTVNVNYEDGTSAVVAEGFVATADLSVPGTQIVEVLYEGFTFSYEIEVIAIETAFIMEFPAKTEYLVGEELDTEGLTLYVLFSNGDELLLTEGFELIYDEFTAEGEYEIIVKYYDYEEPFVVTVVAEEEPEPEPVVVESITVTAPTKTEYTVGDTLDLAGMVVTANLSDGTTENVTAAATVDTTTLATAGNVTVTVTYEGFTATFVVTVAEKVVEPEEPANIAEGTIEGTTVNWVITTDGTLTVSGEGEVPNYTRSATAPWYAYTKQIKKIVVADGVTRLGDYCFYNLSKATAIEISTTVKFLGVQFIRQTAITEVTLTSDVTITANAFGRADNLKTLNLSEDVKNLQGNIFYQETVTIKAPENSFAHKYAEIYASKFASSAATVAYESDGTTAKLPIVRFAAAGDNAFFAIYENAKGNWALEVSGIGVMKNFPYVSAKNIAKGFTFSPMYYIGDEEAKIDGVEPEAKIASITVKEGITTVGNYIFYKCTKATTLTLPEGITSIGQGAFRLCQRIAKITLPEAVTKIEKNAFLSCGKLVEIYIPEGVTTVGEGIFEKCDSINSLVVKTKSAAAIEVISAEYPMVTIVTEF